VLGTHSLGVFALTVLVVNATPGVDMVLVLTRTLRHGVVGGIAAALGVSAGCVVHTLVAAFGLAALLAASAAAFAVVKWAGAAYLLWLAFGMLRDGVRARGPLAVDAERTASPGVARLFAQGLATNVLNPKVAIFFLAFVPQFIAPDADNKALAFVLLGIIFNLNSVPVNSGWALAAAWMARRDAVQRGMHWLDRAAGAMFIAFGLKLAFTDNPAN